MQRSGGAVILMQLNLNKKVLNKITYLVGDPNVINDMQQVPAKNPFDDKIVDFLNEISKQLMKLPEAKAYPDVITFGFWLRKASVLKLKEKYIFSDTYFHVGRGIVFHIAPSNVPVNYAYSLVTGLLTGNANIVRIPSKDFPQVRIINRAISSALEVNEDLKNYVCLVRYGRDQEINDLLSSIADVRVIWGGDNTIYELRTSPLKPRAGEITFADRYSLAVIDSDAYLNSDRKEKISEDFYNDTYLTDQNACTSPRIVVWTGDKVEEAKEVFWNNLHVLVSKKYTFQDIQGINKLTSAYLMSVHDENVIITKNGDNLIYRIQIQNIADDLMELKDNSGFFFEYDCKDILEIKSLCNDTRCQTIGYFGNNEMFTSLINSGVKGIDRIVPIGHTMDFDLIWDGINLMERLTRTICIL